MKRFWDKVKIVEGACWEWQAGDRGNGYGCFKYKGKVYDSHRFVWLLMYGSIADGLLVCHKCDNRKCVNPEHLFIGNAKDNALDRRKKGRSNRPVGVKNPKNKLTSFFRNFLMFDL